MAFYLKKKKFKMLMKLATNSNIPAILYFLLFLSLAMPKKQYPLLAKVKAINKSMESPKIIYSLKHHSQAT